MLTDPLVPRVAPLMCLLSLAASGFSQSKWAGYGGDAQHSAQSTVASQPLNRIVWQAPMDINPTYYGNDLLIHFGSPAITAQNTIIFPVCTASSAPFTIQARNAATGAVLWNQTSSYTFPPYDWVPSFGISLVPAILSNSYIVRDTAHPNAGGTVGTTPVLPGVAWPESGGRVSVRFGPDSVSGPTVTHAFYGDALYNANASVMNANVAICTPITAGSDGSLYFGVQVLGANPGVAQSGLAVIRPNGTGTITGVTALSGGDTGIDRVQMNCAPAISKDGSTVYVAVSAGYWGRGYLTSVSASTLKPIAHVALIDPLYNYWASVVSDGTQSPLVAPDGSVFMGVLEYVFASNDDRGYMLHFSGDLKTSYTPGGFGWDDTGSICPSSLLPSYKGTSSYLVMSKYNNYADFSGDGKNQVALLDPNATMANTDAGGALYNSVTVMNLVAAQVGQTPDPDFPNDPYAVREWCINSAAIDTVNGAIIVNSEDGTLRRWNLKTNTLDQSIVLTPGIGEAYTSTLIAPDGHVFAINNGILFCVGK